MSRYRVQVEFEAVDDVEAHDQVYKLAQRELLDYNAIFRPLAESLIVETTCWEAVEKP